MAGQVAFTPTEEDVVAATRDWARRALLQPRIKGALYVSTIAGALLGAAFALQAGGPADRALRGAALGAVAGLLLVGAVLALRYAMLPGQARRVFRQTRAARTAFAYTWSDEGFSWTSDVSSARIAWADLYRWGEGPTAFMFALSERSIHFVPRRALGAAEADDLRATALRHGPARL